MEVKFNSLPKTGAINSAGECYLHTVEVTGSNPVSPTTADFWSERIPRLSGITYLPNHVFRLELSCSLAGARFRYEVTRVVAFLFKIIVDFFSEKL
jgi:hypothetical protein